MMETSFRKTLYNGFKYRDQVAFNPTWQEITENPPLIIDATGDFLGVSKIADPNLSKDELSKSLKQVKMIVTDSPDLANTIAKWPGLKIASLIYGYAPGIEHPKLTSRENPSIGVLLRDDLDFHVASNARLLINEISRVYNINFFTADGNDYVDRLKIDDTEGRDHKLISDFAEFVNGTDMVIIPTKSTVPYYDLSIVMAFMRAGLPVMSSVCRWNNPICNGRSALLTVNGYLSPAWLSALRKFLGSKTYKGLQGTSITSATVINSRSLNSIPAVQRRMELELSKAQ